MATTLSPLANAILALVKEIEEAKRKEMRVPTNATHKEVTDRVNGALNELYTSGAIQVGDTINSKYIIVNHSE